MAYQPDLLSSLISSNTYLQDKSIFRVLPVLSCPGTHQGSRTLIPRCEIWMKGYGGAATGTPQELCLPTEGAF